MSYDQPELFPLDPVFEAASKRDLKPFEKLTRELDPSNHAESSLVELLELDHNLQGQIFSWVVKVKKPFDLIQRAEGIEEPATVYYGAQKKASKNTEGPSITRALALGTSGRAAIRRQHETTSDHSVIAKERYVAMTNVLKLVRNSRELGPVEVKHACDSLQELANGLAANFDNRYPGGDESAHQVGLTINAFARLAHEDASQLDVSRLVLLSATTNYVLKQRVFWSMKLAAINAFAGQHDIKLETIH